MMRLVERVDVLLVEAMRCTQATLDAFGIDACPIHGSGVLSHLKAAGYKAEPLEPWHWKEGSGTSWSDWDYNNGNDRGLTLGEFMKRNQKGSFYLVTSRHAMALIDGKLTDTSAGTGKRRLVSVIKVTGKGK